MSKRGGWHVLFLMTPLLVLSSGCGRGINSRPSTSGVTSAVTSTVPTITITSLSPQSGLSAGGTSITITGTQFTSRSTAKINNINCASTTYISSTQLRCVSPANGNGSTDISITTVSVVDPSYTTATLASAYTYIGNPSVWLDASQLPSSTTTVSSWTDQSANGLTPTTVGTAPTYRANAQNGLPSVQFNGSQCLGSNTGFPTTTDYTIVAVAKQTSFSTTGNIFSDGTNFSHAFSMFNGNLVMFNNLDTPQTYLTSSISLSLGAFYTLLGTRVNSTGSVQAYVNGSSGGTATDSNANSSAQFGVGCFGGNSQNLTGEIAEILLYGTTVLTNTQQSNISSYLRSKYQHY